jgi:glutamate dehydrogenase
VVAVADSGGRDVVAASRVYFAIDARLQLGRLRDRLEQNTPRNHWERRALSGLYADLMAQHRRLMVEAFACGQVRSDSAEGAAVEDQIGAWLDASVTGFARWQRLLAELERQPSADFTMLSVAVRFLSELRYSESAHAA